MAAKVLPFARRRAVRIKDALVTSNPSSASMIRGWAMRIVPGMNAAAATQLLSVAW